MTIQANWMLLLKNIIKGEIGPYEIYDLLFSDSDESKKNLLIGFATSKYERLLKILEDRFFDKIQIFLPPVISQRDQLAKIAADFILHSYNNTEVDECDSDDLNKLLFNLTMQYQKYYIDQNYNFEIALTGSKRNALACAIISASFKISHCWYVKPYEWNVEKFSAGTADSCYYKIEI